MNTILHIIGKPRFGSADFLCPISYEFLVGCAG